MPSLYRLRNNGDVGMQKTMQQLLIAFFLAITAFLAMLQFKSPSNVNDPSIASSLERIENLQRQVTGLEQRKQELVEELKGYQARMAELEKQGGEDSTYIKHLTEQLDDARILAGLTELEGPGVQVILNDSDREMIEGSNVNAYLVHEQDLLSIVNDLKAAGAEAVALNGQRLLANTQIKCGGPTIVTATERFVPPFIIDAIGDPATLEAILIQPGGIYDILKYWGIQINVNKMDKITVPGYYGPVNFRYAKPVER
ncbi:MAG: hypothetical protein PWQ93_1229 [Clostridiales bacterium]|nr:hypothetical protein [Clostridiales bacterium]